MAQKLVEVHAKQFVEGGPLVYENPYDDNDNWYCIECGAEAGSGGGDHQSICNSQEWTYCGPKDSGFTGPTEADDCETHSFYGE